MENLKIITIRLKNGLWKFGKFSTNVAPLTWRFFVRFKAQKTSKNINESGVKMGFSKMMQILQLKNKGKIVICNCRKFLYSCRKRCSFIK